MLPMEIYTYLSCRRKINETDVSYTYNLQKVWDRQFWLAEWKWLLTILLPYVNIIFSIFFLFCVQNLSCNDSKYHSFNWKDVFVTNVDFFEKKQFSLQFSITCYRFTKCTEFLFAFWFFDFNFFLEKRFFYPRHLPTPTPTTHAVSYTHLTLPTNREV